jgi:hypothetical protein
MRLVKARVHYKLVSSPGGVGHRLVVHRAQRSAAEQRELHQKQGEQCGE